MFRRPSRSSVGGYGCRAALLKWEDQQMPCVAAGRCMRWSVIGTPGPLVLSRCRSGGDFDPILRDGVANGAISSYRGRPRALRPFPQATGPRRVPQNTPAARAVLPRQAGGLGAGCHAAPDYHQRECWVTVALAVMGYRMQSAARHEQATACSGGDVACMSRRENM